MSTKANKKDVNQIAKSVLDQVIASTEKKPSHDNQVKAVKKESSNKK